MLPAAKLARLLTWLPSYGWQRLTRNRKTAPAHLIIAIADHFEPAILPGQGSRPAPVAEQERRLERWCRRYPLAVDSWRDHNGHPLKHTYFYPAEQHVDALIDRLAEHCRGGWGEIEIQLHHGQDAPDTAENTRRALERFRDELSARGCLARMNDDPSPRYAFVHGNWALANSAGGRYCGVDGEMQILAETGCYADMTLPSAPDRGQVAKINSIYEPGLPLDERAPHRRGRDLEVGREPERAPIIVQGPLVLDFDREAIGRAIPRIENGEISSANPPSIRRLGRWIDAGVRVKGREDWAFVKLHCHGMDPRDEEAMYGDVLVAFLSQLSDWADSEGVRLHFVTARELMNVILAACRGCTGDPGNYRDHPLLAAAL